MITRAEISLNNGPTGLAVSVTGASVGSPITAEVPLSALSELVKTWNELVASGFGLDERRLTTFGAQLSSVVLNRQARQSLNWLAMRCVEQGESFLVLLRPAGGLPNSLPWELLTLNGDGCDLGVLALAPGAAFARTADRVDGASSPSEGLRVLVAYANPATPRFPFLPHVEEEVLQLSEFFGRERATVTVERLPNAGPATLARALRRSQPHVVHIIGHAVRSPGGGELALQGGREEEMVGADELASWFVAAGVKTVFLSACDTAGGASGMADTMVAAGVPSVIAMQSAVRDEVQHAFVAEFYREVLRGKTLSEALGYARRSRRHDPGWWIPVLTTSTPLLRLVAPPATAAAQELPRNNLPQQQRRCIGRGADIAMLTQAVMGEGKRMLAITGIGGIGKTRLVTELMTRIGPEFPDGLWVVDCAVAENMDQVAASLAACFGARVAESDVAANLGEQLRDRRALLLFDSAERLVQSGLRDFVETISERCAGVVAIVTSRVSLGWAAEREFPIGPLLVPDLDYSGGDALELFTEIARGSDRNLKIAEEALPVVAEICRLVDGIPLAIQLAASRLRHLSLEQLRDYIRESVADALSDLDDGSDGLLCRVVDSSIDALTVDDRAVLQQLTVFAGGFYLADASAVLNVSEPTLLKTLVRLTNHSVVEVGRLANKPRYRILDIVRERAAATSIKTDLANLVQSHSARFAMHCRELGSLTTEIEAFTSWLWLEIANIRLAYRHAIDRSANHELCAFAQHLSAPFFETGAWDDFQRLASAGFQAAEAEGSHAVSMRLLGLEGALAARRGRTAECEAAWRRRLDVARACGDRGVEADALIDLGTAAFQDRDLDTAEQFVSEALEPAHRSGRNDLVATVHIMRALICIERGQAAEALELARDAETASHGATGSPLIFVYTNLGRVYLAAGDPATGERFYAQALRLASTSKRQFHILGALVGLAKTRRARGDAESAARCLLCAKKLVGHLPSKRAGEIEDLLNAVRLDLEGTAAAAVFPELSPQPWERINADLLIRLDEWGHRQLAGAH